MMLRSAMTGARVLRDIKLNLHPGSRIGLLGANGAGKSTFIKTLMGELAPLRGVLTPGTHLRIGYYAQQQLEVLDLEASAALARATPERPRPQSRRFARSLAASIFMAMPP